MEEKNRNLNDSGDLEDLGYINLILQGDKEVFSRIIDKYERLIYKLAHNFLGKRGEIEDAAQEIFLQVYKSLPNFRLGNRFLPWLYSVALNVLKKKYKYAMKLEKVKESVIKSDFLKEENPVEIMEKNELAQKIRQAVYALPLPLREITILYYLEDLNVKEICDILKIGTENVKSRLFRARKILKKMLANAQLIE